jgi:hypothetical protein
MASVSKCLKTVLIGGEAAPNVIVVTRKKPST